MQRHDDFREIFGSEAGKRVLSHMRSELWAGAPTFVRGDPHLSAFQEGERSVLLLIEHMLAEQSEEQIRAALESSLGPDHDDVD